MNCIDINNREVLETFVFDLEVEKARISHTVELNTLLNREQKLSIMFLPECKLTQPTLFSVVSSYPKVARPVEQFIKTDGKTQKKVDIVVGPFLEDKTFEATLHFNKV